MAAPAVISVVGFPGPALAMTETSSSSSPAAAPQDVCVDVRDNDDNYDKLQNYVYYNDNL